MTVQLFRYSLVIERLMGTGRSGVVEAVWAAVAFNRYRHAPAAEQPGASATG